jgi:SnoaL-like domain
MRISALVSGLLVCSCGASIPRAHLAPEPAAFDAVVDDWHLAAAQSDLERYLGHMTDDSVFLGTDATERWSLAELRAYAEGPFSRGRGWRMRAIRRGWIVRDGYAFFDEDLDAVNLGAARGSGVLEQGQGGVWRIAQYNLSITVPNARFDEVRTLLGSSPAQASRYPPPNRRTTDTE